MCYFIWCIWPASEIWNFSNKLLTSTFLLRKQIWVLLSITIYIVLFFVNMFFVTKRLRKETYLENCILYILLSGQDSLQKHPLLRRWTWKYKVDHSDQCLCLSWNTPWGSRAFWRRKSGEFKEKSIFTSYCRFEFNVSSLSSSTKIKIW
jgi:hypothetical protein